MASELGADDFWFIDCGVMRVRLFLEAGSRAPQQVPKRVACDHHAALGQFFPQLVQGQVRLPPDAGEQPVALALKQIGPLEEG